MNPLARLIDHSSLVRATTCFWVPRDSSGIDTDEILLIAMTLALRVSAKTCMFETPSFSKADRRGHKVER
jgi:hypothetical protein